MGIEIKKFTSYKNTVTHEGMPYDIVCILANDTYDFYAVPANSCAPMAYMFGLPTDQQTLEDAFQMAIDAADEYIDNFCENEWAQPKNGSVKLPPFHSSDIAIYDAFY